MMMRTGFCSTHLTYASRRKNQTSNYAGHIDIYDKTASTYRGRVLVPMTARVLPVHFLSVTVHIPRSDLDNAHYCTTRSCGHGKCVTYLNEQRTNDFCQCEAGWFGHDCTIQYNCTCSSDSVCIGISADQRSICLCPVHKFGPRCLLVENVCTVEGRSVCENSGTCIPLDEYLPAEERFACICRTGFSGDRCEIPDRAIMLSFGNDVAVSHSIFVHFIEAKYDAKPVRMSAKTEGNAFKTGQPVRRDLCVLVKRVIMASNVSLLAVVSAYPSIISSVTTFSRMLASYGTRMW
ncbi:hypothetical protein I4U23_031515 [Adineta vaga]|nr:hypothetical protein I4U23_031515 [Adineta vaga]